MRITVLLVLSYLLCAANSEGQEYKVDASAATEISKLEFMTGKWKGSGWMMGRDGQKSNFKQTEDIRFKLDGTVLLIEGHGQSEGETVHNALAIVRYNKEENNYTFQSFLADGRAGTYKAELKDNKFYWYPNEYISYIIRITDEGQWHETGEMRRGENSYKFFEMTLDKVN